MYQSREVGYVHNKSGKKDNVEDLFFNLACEPNLNPQISLVENGP